MTHLSPILYVEDEEHDVFFLKRALDAVGVKHRLEVAHDGDAAIEYLSGVGDFSDRVRYPLPCLLILDLKMPHRTELEVLEWLRQESPLSHLAVIMFSSSAHQQDIERAYELGANSFVVKPSGVKEREQFARGIKEYWLRFNELSPALRKRGVIL